MIVGLSLAAASDLTPWLRLRLSGMGRYAIPLSDGAPDSWGGGFLGSLEARY